ncbi:CPBP family intramembrane metalloprotease [Candidatus Saccharibacteria bacterium]|nr:CPBP family intramembrane metalloprotease [Candidatus Saccharibacteria bacterium]
MVADNNHVSLRERVAELLFTFGSFVGSVGLGNLLPAMLVLGLISLDIFGDDIFKSLSVNLILLAVANALSLLFLVGISMLQKLKLQELFSLKLPDKKIIWLLPAALAYVTFLVSVMLLVKLLFPSADLEQAQKIPFIGAKGTTQVIISFIALVIVAPIAEELLYRGYLLSRLRKTFPYGVSIFLTSLVFALAHGQLNVGIDTFILSLALCFLVYKTDSIVPSIILHACKNGLAFLLLFVFKL